MQTIPDPVSVEGVWAHSGQTRGFGIDLAVDTLARHPPFSIIHSFSFLPLLRRQAEEWF